MSGRDEETNWNPLSEVKPPLPRLLIPRPRPPPVGHSLAQWPDRPHLKHSLLLIASASELPTAVDTRPAGPDSSPTRGSLERAGGEERWRFLRRTGQLRSQPGTVEVSHRHSQRCHFAQAGENVLWSSPCVLHCDPLSLCWHTH